MLGGLNQAGHIQSYGIFTFAHPTSLASGSQKLEPSYGEGGRPRQVVRLWSCPVSGTYNGSHGSTV